MTPNPETPESDTSLVSSVSADNSSANHSSASSPNGFKPLSPPVQTETRRSQAVDHAMEAISPLSNTLATNSFGATRLLAQRTSNQPPIAVIVLLAIAVMLVGWLLNSFWIGMAGTLVALVISLRVVWAALRPVLNELVSSEQWTLSISLLGLIAAILGLLQFSGVNQRLGIWLKQLNWDAVGAGGEVIGAVGQISIAVLAVYVAWRQYVISKDLTIQQNLITQQQTIDSYFQGISELVLDEEGLLEDWPQERAIAEGRTAAILSSVDPTGKAKILRFLSRSRLLTPLRRDRRLGRAMLDGMGGYAEDRDAGVRVIDLGVMLATANLSGTDLRWTDLSDANLIRADLSRCDLVKTNLARTILVDSTLAGADLMGARFFYGSVVTASPRSRTEIPNYQTGAYTGAVVENVDFTGVTRMSEAQRQYCCAWSGSASRTTIPGGCEGISNRLGR
jgi:uncharacterized protein YjbI with pentapeptide repeats